MRILGIDPGTKCGWALRDPSGTMTSGVWDLAVKRHESAGMRFIRLRGHLNEIYNATPFDLLAYEEVRRHMGTDAAHIYGGIVAVIQEWCVEIYDQQEVAANHIGIPVGTIKKFATGKGNAGKAVMVDAAHVKWGEFGPLNGDDNEADARWIAEYAAQEYGNI